MSNLGDHGPVRLGELAKRLELGPLLRMHHSRGYPCWEIDEDGSAMPYDGWHHALAVRPANPEEWPSPC